MDNRPIGMFDSGVGGLTILKEVIKNNTHEKIIYLGDTKRFPYGNKSKDTIVELTKKGIEFLISKNVKAVIIACGTATSQALEEVKNVYSIPIIGIIQPTVEYIKENTKLRRIGVIATTGTIRSKGWEKSILQNIDNCTVQNKACPLLAPMAEEGWTDNEVAKLTVKEYLKDMKDIDCLILGCTHYPLFKSIIQNQVGQNVEVINTGEMVSKYINQILETNELQNTQISSREYEIYLTDKETNFINVANKLLEIDDMQDKIKIANI